MGSDFIGYFKNNLYLWVKLFMQMSLLVSLCLAIYRLEWLTVFLVSMIMLLTLIPLRLNTQLNIVIPLEIEILSLAIIYASLYLGEIGNYYEKYWWWDILLHSGSGFLFGVLGFLLIWILNDKPKSYLGLSPFFMALVSFSFSITMGVAWEVFEFTLDQSFGLNMQKSGLVDTMWDLIVVCIGALCVSGFGYSYLKFGYRSFASQWFEDFVENNPHIFNENKT
ncbi:MAG: hypothetical protein KUG82_09795 [Pseudomonadales bacterium]|nr:hypothetical protein [Pseudomonadales bacterium]